MKFRLISLISLGLAGLLHAQTSENYSDATGEITVTTPNDHIDIDSVDVELDVAEENLTFTINLVGDPSATNWGKYMIAIRSGAGGATTGNGWGRPINFSTGMTRWIGGWADGGPPAGGVQLWTYSGGSWSQTKASTDPVDPLALPVITTSSYSVTVPVSLLGLIPGQTFTFDVYTSGGGGGDGAADALSASGASISNWGDTYTTTSPLSFTMPGTLDPGGDEDLDGYTNADEINGTSALGYQSDPLIPNYTDMNVSGDFNGWSTSAGDMEQGDTGSLETQYQWTYERRFGTPAQSISYKFTTGNSFTINWGQGGSAGTVARDGDNIGGFVGASGIYRFFFDQGNLTQTFTRRTFASASEFLTAYGLDGDPTGDADLDNVSNENEFAANTDPLNEDTDGDGINDDTDTQPLVQLRDITFSVDMSVQIAKGNHTGGDDVELLVFSGAMLSPNPGSGYLMSGPDVNGIYTVTLTDVPGFETQPFGQYKFYNSTAGAPNSGYEEISDRNFNLGAPESTQTLDTVFFSNDSTLPGYNSWASTNAGGQAANLDFDGDGIDNGAEYFMGTAGNAFTPNPQVVAGAVTWPRAAGTVISSFKVEVSSDLVNWQDAATAYPANLSISDTQVVFTLPAGAGKIFSRLSVTP